MYRLTKESFFEYDEGACADLGGGGGGGEGSGHNEIMEDHA